MKGFLGFGLGFLTLAVGLGLRHRHDAPHLAAPARIAVPPVAQETLVTGLTSITAITHAGDARLFLTLQLGEIVIWDGTQILPTAFLDVSSLITCCGERGLLSTAFHPQYAQNGFFFVNYTDLNGATVVARYRVSDDSNVADPSSGVTLLTIPQPFENHNGGQLQFGPDGFLYIGMGDGGSGNDPFCNAQRPDTLLGKMLRIDVDQNVDTPPHYGVPPDNPFLASGGPPEAWANGLRNPWRFSFDRVTGDLFIGDVGQGAREEIDYQPGASQGGENYGWKVMEGTLCGTQDGVGCPPPGVPPCGDPSYTLPILEYSHEVGCSVTGGYVYRGLSIPDLYGMYVYGDYCSGQIFAAVQQDGSWTTSPFPFQVSPLTTFGEDAAGELYIGTETGTLFRVLANGPPAPTIINVSPSSGLTRGGTAVTITGTNFTGASEVTFGSIPALVQVHSPTTLTALAPENTPGVVDVVVTNPGAPPATAVGAFAYVAIPRVAPHPETRVVDRPLP